MKPIRIPRRIDEPPHLLLWSADELAPMLLGLTIGMMIGKAFICFFVGFVISHFYKRFKDNYPDGYLLHLLYWGGLLMKKTPSLKNPYIKRFLP